MLKIRYPIIVEGKYDKIRLSAVADARIYTTDGFGIFKKDDRARFLRRIAEASGGILVLTDSDGAGLVIRNYLRNILPPELVFHLYTPRVAGKEKRKSEPSKEGILGVEGMELSFLAEALAPFAESSDGQMPRQTLSLTKADLFAMGLSGGAGSAVRRTALLRALDLPENLSANALLEALNLFISKEELEKALTSVGAQNEGEKNLETK